MCNDHDTISTINQMKTVFKPVCSNTITKYHLNTRHIFRHGLQ